jgi:tetratricopeptide (TPR) repeat protein
MNNYQLNRYKMYRMVRDYLNEHSDKLNDFPGFKEKCAVMLSKIEEIEGASRVQSEFTNKISFEKNSRRRELETKMVEISRKMAAYAILNDNNTLLANCSYTPWRVGRYTNIDLASQGGNLFNHATEYLENLAQYGITPELVESLQMAIDDYEKVIADPRTNDVNSSVATKKMAQAYKDADEALRFIDLAVKIAGDADPGFYSEYRSMRKQIKSGVVKMALKANAIDAVSRGPVENVSFTFTFIAPEKKNPKKKFQIVKKTKKLGGLKIMHMPAGKYDVVARKAGYRDVEMEVVINPAGLVKIVAELGKI